VDERARGEYAASTFRPRPEVTKYVRTECCPVDGSNTVITQSARDINTHVRTKVRVNYKKLPDRFPNTTSGRPQ